MFKSIKYFFQRLFRGWDDRETWNLDFEFYKWLYPRLKRFQEISITYPPDKTWHQWNSEIKWILKVLEIHILNEEIYFSESETIEKAKQEVNNWFIKNFNNLKW